MSWDNLKRFTKRIYTSYPFESDVPIDELDQHLDEIKKDVRSEYEVLMKEMPEAIDVKVSLGLDYDDCDYSGKESIVFSFIGKRPSTSKEIEDLKKIEEDRCKLRLAQYENLKKEFEPK